MPDPAPSADLVDPFATGRAPDAWRWAITIVGGVMIVHAITLHVMGRIWWCACGQPSPVGHGGEHNSQHLFDWYTPSHLLHGVIFYWLLLWPMKRGPLTTRLWVATLIEIVWEFIENTPLIIDRYRAQTTATSYYGDSILNSLSDVLACIFGFILAARVGWRWSIAIFVGFELLTLWLIRDNLTLNVLMLLFPIDAIRAWQGR